MKTIMIAFRQGAENGGPYNSHLRIMQSNLKEKYTFIPLFVPKGRMGLFNIRIIYNLVKQIKKAKPDAVQIVGLELIGFYLTVACKLSGIKNIILAIHGSTSEAIEFNKNIFKKEIMNILEMYTLSGAKIAFGVSKYVHEIRNVKRYSKNYYGHIYNMLLENTTEIDGHAIRKELNIPAENIVIISAGRIEKEKGYELLVKVIKYFNNNHRMTFLIAGTGSYLDNMKVALKTQLDKGQVLFLGFQKDIKRILSTGDIFVMPSFHETLCMSLIEAGQCGLALIASNVGGMREVVTNEENGFLVSLGSANEFIKRIEELVNDRSKLLRFKENAQKTINFRFANNISLSRLDELYSMILS